MNNLTKAEKQNKLDEAIITLKSEFIGLDKILDQLKEAIIPWYMTPNLIKSPSIISLWGLTGTGKSSVVNRLIDLLELNHRKTLFDCGEDNGKSYRSQTVTDSIVSRFGERGFVEDDLQRIFIFDEFQHAKTISRGEDIDSPHNRAIWNLLDDGKLIDNDGVNRYEFKYIIKELTDMEFFTSKFPDIRLEYLKIIDSKDVDLAKNYLGYGNTRFGGKISEYYAVNKTESSSIGAAIKETPTSNSDECDINKDRILSTYGLEVILNQVRQKYTKNEVDPSKLIDELLNSKTTKELSIKLKHIKELLLKPTVYDFKSSLVFILGNLDEAFGVEKDLNPDLDADMFCEITSNVSTLDIKNALNKRFRAEQIARFGNNIIKYPSLSKNSFKKIIKKEVGRICSEFKRSEFIDVTLDESIIDLIYSEGVYPVQGVRPLISTISTLLIPLLSMISLESSISNGSEVFIKVTNESDWKINKYKIPSTEVSMIFQKSKETLKKTINLDLGSLREPSKSKNIEVISVHELGHAIVYTYRTGQLPVLVSAKSSNSGGLCTTFDSNQLGKIHSKYDVDTEIMVSLGGILAERLIFDDEDCLMGSQSDLEKCWNVLSNAAYSEGFFQTIPFSNRTIEAKSFNTIPGGFDSDEENLEGKMKHHINQLIEKVNKVLSDEEKLIISAKDLLSKAGSIDGTEFGNLVNKFGSNLLKNKLFSNNHKKLKVLTKREKEILSSPQNIPLYPLLTTHISNG